MSTNNYGLRNDNLEKRIREAEMSEANRDLLWKFKRNLEFWDCSNGRIYKLLNYLKITAEYINFENATEEDIKDTVVWLNRKDVASVAEKTRKLS